MGKPINHFRFILPCEIYPPDFRRSLPSARDGKNWTKSRERIARARMSFLCLSRPVKNFLQFSHPSDVPLPTLAGRSLTLPTGDALSFRCSDAFSASPMRPASSISINLLWCVSASPGIFLQTQRRRGLLVAFQRQIMFETSAERV